jgi:hypothetical protein
MTVVMLGKEYSFDARRRGRVIEYDDELEGDPH